jgi:hypothetical protein
MYYIHYTQNTIAETSEEREEYPVPSAETENGSRRLEAA